MRISKERSTRWSIFVKMVDLWPLSVFYRAYFGTMKFKERFAFCVCIVLLIVPFIWLRMRVSDEKHPLLVAVDGKNSHSVTDETDFNRIDHSHINVQRSNEGTNPKKTNRDSKDVDHRQEKRSVGKDTNDENVASEKETKRNIANNDMDYEYDDPWSTWKDMVKSRQITSPDDADAVNMILEAMMYKPIVAAGVGYRGTQLKATLILEGKQRVVFKPMR